MRIFLSCDSLSVRFLANSFNERNGKKRRQANFFLFLLVIFFEGWNEMRKESNTYFYACKNRKTPDLDKQLDDFRKSGAEERNIFTDSAGKREIFRLLVDDILKSGDTLVIGSLFCLGEKSDEIIRNIEFFIFLNRNHKQIVSQLFRQYESFLVLSDCNII